MLSRKGKGRLAHIWLKKGMEDYYMNHRGRRANRKGEEDKGKKFR